MFCAKTFVFILFICCLNCVRAQIWNDIFNGERFKEAYSGILNLLPAEKISSTPNLTPTQPTTVLNIPKCGRSIINHKGLITHASPTKPGDWPWHSALYHVKSAGRQRMYRCGGTLISTTRVLTAGHCVQGNQNIISPETLFVVLGKYEIIGGESTSQESGVFDIILHPEYNEKNLANDIALLKLSNKLTYTDYIQPICLRDNPSNKGTIVNQRGTVVGWGLNEDGIFSTELVGATMAVVDDVTCIRSNPLFFSKFLSDTSFCAGDNNGTSVCNGDSGGGMYFSEVGEDGEDTWFLRGIVSLAVAKKNSKTCDPSKYVIFTDSVQYLDFIKSNM